MPTEIYYLDWEGGMYFLSKSEAEETQAWYAKEFDPEDYGDVQVQTIQVDFDFLKEILHIK